MVITRKVEFSASHVCRSPQLSEEENQRIFGMASNRHGHGHNYVVEVSLMGDPDPITGMVLDLKELKEILTRDLANPPTLEMLGQEVGCSPFYLSRIFSREVGQTIPQYLRNVRMERAAELLRTGRYNVTEAATEVGYSSLSHFSKAFCETIGCCPVLYPVAKNVLLDR